MKEWVNKYFQDTMKCEQEIDGTVGQEKDVPRESSKFSLGVK